VVQQYLFGDTDIAAQRLRVLSEVFANSTIAFVTSVVEAAPRLTVDLGCGPGYCTHMLAKVLRPARTVGLDNSEHFLSLARETETEDVSFQLHDVTSVPFPVASTDLAYCRFLLTHLREPQQAIARWATQLHPDGLLVIEEVQAIQTSNRTFRAYLSIVEAMLADQDGCLYVGPVLASLCGDDALAPRVNQVMRLAVPNHRAATMFFLNLQSWRNQPFVCANFSKQEIADLEACLSGIASDSSDRIEIEWDLRQVALARR
jgi:trans-aconitate 2-methyltransferase